MTDHNNTITPRVSIIIPVFNKLDFTRNCLDALKENTPHDVIEVIIVDNASTDGTYEFLASWEAAFPLKVIRNETNQGFAKANNQGARMAIGDYLVLLNNDTVPKPNWLPPLLNVFKNQTNVGAVGSKLLYPNGTIQHAGVVTLKDDVRKHPLIPVHFGHKNPDSSGFNKLRRFPAVTGACMMVTKDLYEKVGGLDEKFWNGFEDVDFCFKILEEGLDIYFQPDSVLIHYESQSGDQRFVRESENFLELIRRWKDRITCQLVVKENNRLIPNDGVTIVIVTYNSMGTISACLEHLDDTMRPQDEVIIIDNASMDQTQGLVRQYATGKKQCKFIINEDNLGYAHAANMGADAGHNPFIVFLNPDACVTPLWIEHLLFHLKTHIVAAVGPLSNYVAGSQQVAMHLPKERNDHSEAKSLHDIIWERNEGKSRPTKLLIGFCLMIKRKVFDAIGGMDKALFLGNDDLDLSWRVRQAGYRLVVATDTLVYHKGQESFASESRALTDLLVQESTDYLYYKLAIQYGLENIPSGLELWDVDWFSPTSVFKEAIPLTSMVLLTYNQLQYTRLCVESIFKHTHSPFELIVVDNGSKDGSVEYLTSLSRAGTACIRIKVITNKINNGFAGGCNQGLAVARGEQLLLINNDVVVTPGWLSTLSKTLRLPHVGFCGPVSNCVAGHQLVKEVAYDVSTLNGLEQFSIDHAHQHAGQIIHNWRLVGFCLLIKREVIKKIGGLDERYEIGSFEDDDFCLRAYLSGHKGVIAKDCFIHHFGSRSFLGNNIDLRDQLQENWKTFKNKWAISSEIPYSSQYQVPTPTDGFDHAKHYVRIHTDPQRCVDNAVNDSAKCAQAHNQNANQKYKNNKTPGGISMQILDQVLDAVKDPFFSEKSDAAMWILERLIEAAPDQGIAQHELGLLCYEHDQLAKAQAHLHQAARICPNNPVIFKDLGDFYQVVHKDSVHALQMYDKAIELDPSDNRLLLTAAHLCTAEKSFDKARGYYQRVLEIEPDNQDALTCLNKLNAGIGKGERCDTVDALYARAQSQLQGGDRDGAAVSLYEILKISPEHALAHNDSGVLAYEKEDKEKARYHYEKAVSIDPRNLKFLKNLADFYWLENNDAHAAMTLYVQILSKNPADIEAILSCAQVCIALEKYDDANDFIDRARAIDPYDENVCGLNQQLQKLHASGQPQSNREMLYQKAKVIAADGDLEGATQVLTEIINANSQDAEVFNSLGVLYYELGQKEKAHSCYRQAVKLMPQQDTYCKNLADYYLIEQGRAEDAMKLYLSVLENNPKDEDCLLATGLICMSHKKIEDAKGFFEKVREINPNNQSALQALRQIDEPPSIHPDDGIALNTQSLDEKTEAFG